MQGGSVTVRMVAIGVAAGCVLLLVWLMNHTMAVDVVSQPGETGQHTADNSELVPVVPRSNRVASMDTDNTEVVPFTGDTPALADLPNADKNSDYASYAAIAQILSSAPGDDSGLPSEEALRKLDDEAIERLVETNLAERYERITRLVEFQSELDEGVVTGLRVIPRGSPGADLLLGFGLLQNDIIISVNGKDFPSVAAPEILPGSFIVDLLTAPSTRLKVLRGGSETLVIVEPGMPGGEGQSVPH